MGIFLDAAKQWNHMTELSYQIVIGYKNTSRTISLVFRPEDFPHLSGMQYATDVDFSLHKKQYDGDKLIPALITGKMDNTLIEKSERWPRIQDRLSLILELENILDSDFLIYAFSAKKLPFHSHIDAAYLIYSEQHKQGMFLFIDEDEESYFCKSIFSEDNSSYRTNQTQWTVLKKEKYCDGQMKTMYIRPSYKGE